jgi:hypothetical protein
MTETLSISPARSDARSFYSRMAQICLGVAVVGFAPTYWRGLANGTFHGGPIVHLHALIFYAWMALLVVQAVLIAQGRVGRHREFGFIGVALATLLVVSGMAVSITAGLRFEQAGFGREARAFVIVSWSSMALFGALVWLAVAKVRQPDRHRRLMLAATISMLGAPIARWILLLVAPEVLSSGAAAPPPPVLVTVPPALLGDLLFIPMLMHDRRTLGRFHPTTVKAALAVIATQILIVPVSSTSAWDQFASLVLLVGRPW